MDTLFQRGYQQHSLIPLGLERPERGRGQIGGGVRDGQGQRGAGSEREVKVLVMVNWLKHIHTEKMNNTIMCTCISIC